MGGGFVVLAVGAAITRRASRERKPRFGFGAPRMAADRMILERILASEQQE